MNRRQPAVADMFYPGDPEQLRFMLKEMLDSAPRQDIHPKAIIAPHAGYVYSGPVAASVYKLLIPLRAMIKTVILLGPSHRVAFRGIATSTADAFSTPLGDIPLDREKIALIQSLPQVHSLDQAHAQEHSLEVHLPFLQTCLGDIKLVPIVVGDANPEQVAEVLEKVWGDESTLTIVSSDLSHFHSYQVAQRMDKDTSEAIERLDIDNIGDDDACGRNPIKGLLSLAREKDLHIKTIDLRNSGDTAGSKDRVVGYGAYVVY